MGNEYLSKEAKFQELDLKIAREWADNNEHFDDTFIASLEKQFIERGFLTDKQHVALVNLIDKWGMESASGSGEIDFDEDKFRRVNKKYEDQYED